MKLTRPRIRKVKCDETRPYCRKCTESGRKCEGPIARQFRFVHDEPFSRSTTPTPQLEVSLLTPQHNKDERRAFHYFTHRDAPISAGHIDARFWQDLVPQLAHTYEFVWDTVVCLGFLNEHVDYTSLTPRFDSTGLGKVTNREHRQALRIYNRAITNVRQLAERGQIDDSVVVLSYTLFASVESQQSNVKTANDLWKRCGMILTENLTSLPTMQKSSADQVVHEVITPFVLTKAVVIATLTNTLSPRCDANNEVTKVLKTVQSRSTMLDEAKNELNSLMDHCFEVIRHADFFPNIKDDDPVKVLFLSQRQSSLDKLIQWKAVFTATRSRTSDVETDWICSYLLVYWEVCYIFLATCISLRQTSFDEYIDHFAEIIKHATIFLEHSLKSTNVQLLSSADLGIIPPLYFCATKCRDPILRREALHLIRQAPRQEDLWAFVAPDRVAAKVIAVEEGNCHFSFLKHSPESRYAGLPPEERRFAYFSVVGRLAPGGKLRQALELSRFKFASDGSRRLVNDYVWLEEEDGWDDTCGRCRATAPALEHRLVK